MQGKQLQDGTAHGLESLRSFEGMAGKHAPGAITNPAAYAEPSRKSAPAVGMPAADLMVSKFAQFGGSSSSSMSFGNPTRKFAP